MSRARSQSDLVVVKRWPREWSKQSLYVVRRVALKAEELPDAIDDALEVDKRSSCRGLPKTSGSTKKCRRRWIMVARGAAILRSKSNKKKKKKKKKGPTY